MTTDGEINQETDDQLAASLPKNYQYQTVRVNMREAIGTSFLGIVALVLLVALLRAEARNRALLARLKS